MNSEAIPSWKQTAEGSLFSLLEGLDWEHTGLLAHLAKSQQLPICETELL